MDTIVGTNFSLPKSNVSLAVAEKNFQLILKNLMGPPLIQPKSWWDPLNLFGTKNEVNTTTTTTTTTTKAPTTKPVTALTSTTTPKPGGGWWNPFSLVTGAIDAVGSAIVNVGTSVVNLVTGGGGQTTSTTPFPYPDVAAFFSDPAATVTGHKQNVTLKPEIVKCLANLLFVYGDALKRMSAYLPNCIMDQKFSVVWIAPQLLGLLPILKLINIPSDVRKNCKYINGCLVKAILETLYEVDGAIDKLARNLNGAMPTVTDMGKAAINCVANNFKNLAHELPKTAKLTCLKQ